MSSLKEMGMPGSKLELFSWCYDIVKKELGETTRPTKTAQECKRRKELGIYPFDAYQANLMEKLTKEISEEDEEDGDFLVQENGLIYFRVYREKDGKITELRELEEEGDNSMMCFHAKIYELFNDFIKSLDFMIVRHFFQVDLHTLNDGPLIDFCIERHDGMDSEGFGSAKKFSTKNFKFELTEKVGDSTFYATTTLLPPTELDSAKLRIGMGHCNGPSAAKRPDLVARGGGSAGQGPATISQT